MQICCFCCVNNLECFRQHPHCCYENMCGQLTLSIYSAGKMTNNQTFGKRRVLARESCNAALLYPQDCQVVALRFIILYFLLDFLFLSFISTFIYHCILNRIAKFVCIWHWIHTLLLNAELREICGNLNLLKWKRYVMHSWDCARTNDINLQVREFTSSLENTSSLVTRVHWKANDPWTNVSYYLGCRFHSPPWHCTVDRWSPLRSESKINALREQFRFTAFCRFGSLNNYIYCTTL
jgi:hypothetical protein